MNGMLPDYVVIGGVEVISTARAQALGAEAGECGADEVCWDCEEGAAEWLNNNEPYGTVEDAPWYDPAVPESASVLGFGGLEITGMTERVGTTGNDPARREFTLRFAAFLADECGLEYAHDWVSSMFSPSPCATSCVGHEMCMIACCPDVDGETGELAGPDPLRHLYDVEVVSGPTMIERSWESPLWIEYEVTLGTPNVYVWRPPPAERVWRVRPSDGQIVTLDLPAVYEACPDDDECAAQFACPSPDFAPLPAEPLPACYPAEPFSAHRTLVSVPARTMPRGDVVPVIRAEAGNRPLRNLVIRFYDNPLDVPCDRLPDMNPCRACMDLTVAEIPPNGSIIMDGRTGLNTITCKNSRGRDVQIPASVYGPPVDGVGAGYVDAIPCGPGICLEIYTAEGAAVNAEVVVEFWTRANGG